MNKDDWRVLEKIDNENASGNMVYARGSRRRQPLKISF